MSSKIVHHICYHLVFLPSAVCGIHLAGDIYGTMACRFYIFVTNLQAFGQKIKKGPKVLLFLLILLCQKSLPP